MAFWDVKYEGNVKPDDDGWSVGDDDRGSVSGGILTIDTMASMSLTCQYQRATNFDFSTGATLEFRAKVVDTYGAGPFSVWIGDDNYQVAIILLESEIRVQDGYVKICDFDTTDTFHTYKLKVLNTTATLYIDGVDKGNFGLKSLALNTIKFGDAYNNASIKIYIDYFYYAGSVDYSVPTVETDSATSVKGNYCIGNLDITDNGGEFITEYGFEYGEGEEVGNFCVRRTGASLGLGEHSLTIDGLKPETTYYYRAFATNSVGEGYGSWVSFTTTALPSYGIYEESNTATICFYVRRAGGKWSIKHGPYTEDQADIEIGKILTEGKGKYQIKFTSDVLTGLSVNIMTKLDIKAR